MFMQMSSPQSPWRTSMGKCHVMVKQQSSCKPPPTGAQTSSCMKKQAIAPCTTMMTGRLCMALLGNECVTYGTSAARFTESSLQLS